MRIGLVGCGKWGRLILRDLRSLECEVPVVARSASSRANAEQGGASLIADSVATLGEMDGVVVATTTHTHAQVIFELLEKTAAPIFVEKPISNDISDARRIAQLGADRIFVMDKWRYHPAIEELGSIARRQELGKVIGLRSTRNGWGQVHDDVDPIWVLAPHDLSIALEVLGAFPAPRSAVTEPGGQGLIAIMGEDPWFVFEVTASSIGRYREVRLICEAGVAVVTDRDYDHVQIGRPGPQRTEPVIESRAVSTEMPLLRELRAFVEHLNGGPAPRTSAEEAVRNVTLIQQLRDMAQN